MGLYPSMTRNDPDWEPERKGRNDRSYETAFTSKEGVCDNCRKNLRVSPYMHETQMLCASCAAEQKSKADAAKTLANRLKA